GSSGNVFGEGSRAARAGYVFVGDLRICRLKLSRTTEWGSACGGRGAVAVAGAGGVAAGDFDRDPGPASIFSDNRGWVAEQVLIRQPSEDLGERLAQIVDAGGEERAAAGRLRQAHEHLLQLLERGPAALTDGVQHGVALLQTPLDLVDRRAAGG